VRNNRYVASLIFQYVIMDVKRNLYCTLVQFCCLWHCSWSPKGKEVKIFLFLFVKRSVTILYVAHKDL